MMEPTNILDQSEDSVLVQRLRKYKHLTKRVLFIGISLNIVGLLLMFGQRNASLNSAAAAETAFLVLLLYILPPLLSLVILSIPALLIAIIPVRGISYGWRFLRWWGWTCLLMGTLSLFSFLVQAFMV